MSRYIILIAALCFINAGISAQQVSAQNDWYEDPSTERYLISQTGRNIEKGSGYYQNVLIFFNSAHYGLTDWFSLGVGFEAISTFSGNPILLVLPKIGLELSENFSLGAGVHYLNASVIASEAHGGIAYGVGTYHFDKSNISIGAGWAFLQDEFSNEPVITLSGMTRLSRRIGLVSENWIFPTGDSNYALFTYGVRFIGENTSFDISFINSKDIAKTFPVGLPAWASFSFYF